MDYNKTNTLHIRVSANDKEALTQIFERDSFPGESFSAFLLRMLKRKLKIPYQRDNTNTLTEEESDTYLYQLCVESIRTNARRNVAKSYDQLIDDVADRVCLEGKLDTEHMDIEAVVRPYMTRAIDAERDDFRRKISLDIIEEVKKTYEKTQSEFVAFMAGFDAYRKLDVQTGLSQKDRDDIVHKLMELAIKQ